MAEALSTVDHDSDAATPARACTATAMVKKHKGDMKAASNEYKQQQGSGLTDAIERKVKGKIKERVFQKGDAAIDKQVSNPALRAALHAGLHAGVDTLASSCL